MTQRQLLLLTLSMTYVIIIHLLITYQCSTNSGVMFAPLVCRKCSKRRTERREIITEIVETEEKYGRDLRIILEEFYRPMQVAGLLTSEQLSAIFLNTEELLEHNSILAEKLRDALEIAVEQGDEDLLTVNVGSLFLEASPMLHAFESYCTRQVHFDLFKKMRYNITLIESNGDIGGLNTEILRFAQCLIIVIRYIITIFPK